MFTSFLNFLLVCNLDDRSSIALGNTIGSNIANITLVLGISAIIYNVQVLNLKLFSYYGSFNFIFRFISYNSGIFSFFCFCFSCKFNFNCQNIQKSNNNQIRKYQPFQKFFYFFLSYKIYYFLVEGAVDIASYFNVSDKVIAVTILAVGTSLPELAIQLLQPYKKKIV